MGTSTHGDHLIKITRMGMMNCFLVREDDGFTLIDTLMKGSEGQIMQAAQDAGAPVVRILLTHAHVDHAGSVDALHAALPDAEVIYPAREARFLAGDMSLDPDETKGELRGGYVTTATKPARTLQPGERVGSLEAVAAPGHTPGQFAYLDTRDNTLIAGDAWATLFGVTVPSHLSWFPLPYMATWHRPTAFETAKTLRALNPSRLAVGHGPVIESPGQKMDRELQKAERALK